MPLVNNSSNSNAWGTSRFLEKGDFLRFKEITLSYNLPQSLLKNAKVENLRFFITGNNVYTWHNVSYFDPDRPVTGGGYIKFPSVKTLMFGLELGF